VVIRLNEAGQILAGSGQVMPPQQAQAHLVRMARSGAFGMVTIQAPPATSFANVTQTLRLVEQAGFQRVSFAASPAARTPERAPAKTE